MLAVRDAVVYGDAERHFGDDECGFVAKSPVAGRARAILWREGGSGVAVRREYDV